MVRLAPISRREFIRRMLALGFDGPFAGGNHEFLIRDERRLILPNPHQGEISVALLTRLLRQAGVTREQWERA
ncbi:type II toxin-antitoxin system HicA family toxin [Desulfonatronum lacustre]|uniref:type II toxin-antitoxin system HicA family toxin n=1 Tax=Desulfonatronum lacustre TaxID=66849 RepID=UPI000A019AD7|nr:type II toxin-antitoxin system HicA family toxin [Desulfonatronum lacustre]